MGPAGVAESVLQVQEIALFAQFDKEKCGYAANVVLGGHIFAFVDIVGIAGLAFVGL
jgi:hypothetical protein